MRVEREIQRGSRDLHSTLNAQLSTAFLSAETEAHKLLPDQTDLSAAVKKNGLALKVFGITQNKVSYLERSIGLLEQYKMAFEQEGNRDFWAARILYDRNMLKRVQEGLTKSFLYFVSK